MLGEKGHQKMSRIAVISRSGLTYPVSEMQNSENLYPVIIIPHHPRVHINLMYDFYKIVGL